MFIYTPKMMNMVNFANLKCSSVLSKLFRIIFLLTVCLVHSRPHVNQCQSIKITGYMSPSRQFWDRRRWKSGLSIVIWDCGRWKSGPCLLGWVRWKIHKPYLCMPRSYTEYISMPQLTEYATVIRLIFVYSNATVVYLPMRIEGIE